MFNIICNFSPIKIVVKQIDENYKNIFVKISENSFNPFFYLSLAKETKKNLIIITSSDEIFSNYSDLLELKEFFNVNNEIILYPDDDSYFYENIKISKEIEKQRIEAIKKILSNEIKKILITNISALAEKIDTDDNLKKNIFKLRKGEKLKIEEILDVLNKNKYERVVRVEEIFQYSLRGNILDIFSPDQIYPVRLEFSDDSIESIRLFSIETNQTEKQIDEVELFLYKFLNENYHSSVIDFFDYKDTIIIINDYEILKKEILEKIQKIEKYLKNRTIENRIFNLKTIYKRLSKFVKIKNSFISVKGIKFDIKPNPVFKRNLEELISYLVKLNEQNYEILFLSDNKGETQHLKEILKEKNIKNLKFYNAGIEKGFNIPELKLCLITNREIFERYKGKLSKKIIKDKNLKPIKNYLELKEGDFIVHREHGIGVFEGVKTLTIDDVTYDFILLRYDREDKLYIPIYRMDLIDKYVGSEKIPCLSRLGSSYFKRTKEEIRKELKFIAEELLKIYAQRKMEKGIKYPPFDEFEKEFAESFLYEETEDQKKAILDVLSDMEKEKPMDRLICGDAGFGKTEVALRASFKAVKAGKKVLMLTSTTLLALQHFNTFKERFADYPFKIEMLSRLVTRKKREEIIKKIKMGAIDILIGTHSVLNPKIEILDLGLVIVDEEQHFGVKAKEFLRKKYPHCDFLTLTATPIPRTLYLSLSGIRDISVINTPPFYKKPIETYIVEEKLSIVKEIILREILRKGQVFYIHNNINTIFKLKEILMQNLPEVKFEIAHGKMKKSKLEKIMFDFLEKKFDVLLTTTIVESGLDLPNVNTIIISNAEKFGLSQLYQLRGRVGRREKQAYAYLLVKDKFSLSEVARERLKAIENYIDPGAGFYIAMKDLEIRGAGTILGTKQHGNMEKVGFELYCKMLEEEVNKLMNKKIEEEVDTKIEVDYKAYIPESYIWDSAEKIRIYRQLFISKNISDIENIKNSLFDIWGELPEEVKNILLVGKFKIIGRKLKIDEIYHKENKITFIWKEKKVPEKIKKIIFKYKNFFQEGKNNIVFTLKNVNYIEKLLEEIEKNYGSF